MSSTEEIYREQIASIQHDQWSGWILHLWTICESSPDGSAIIPNDIVELWTRQTNTPYKKLTNKEKKSDLIEAGKILTILSRQDEFYQQMLAVREREISALELKISEMTEDYSTSGYQI